MDDDNGTTPMCASFNSVMGQSNQEFYETVASA
jgi:hypothetical protein